MPTTILPVFPRRLIEWARANEELTQFLQHVQQHGKTEQRVRMIREKNSTVRHAASSLRSGANLTRQTIPESLAPIVQQQADTIVPTADNFDIDQESGAARELCSHIIKDPILSDLLQSHEPTLFSSLQQLSAT